MCNNIERMKFEKLTLVVFITFLSCSVSAQVVNRFDKNSGESPKQENIAKVPEPKSSRPDQSSKSGFDPNKLVYGGGLSLQFGTVDLIYLSPNVGYRVNDWFVPTVGFIYQYYSSEYYAGAGGLVKGPRYEDHMYGPNVNLSFFPTSKLFLGLQWEMLNRDFQGYTSSGLGEVENLWVNMLFIAGGFSQPTGEKGFVQIGFRYDLVQDYRSPYPSGFSPFINFYF